MKKAHAVAALGVIIAVALTGCTAEDQFGQAEKAELPSFVTVKDAAPLEGSVRHLGRDESGVDYYVGKWSSENGDESCFVAVNGEDFASACGNQMPLAVSLQGANATLSPTRIGDVETGAEAVGPYVTVRR
ncbi:hypothetical protein [Microbacterium gorillae]|uniref:hypothetical protein n=1 Tax=Microbacterium gorillae TaxID=1231063 RepID=UPI003D990864